MIPAHFDPLSYSFFLSPSLSLCCHFAHSYEYKSAVANGTFAFFCSFNLSLHLRWNVDFEIYALLLLILNRFALITQILFICLNGQKSRKFPLSRINFTVSLSERKVERARGNSHIFFCFCQIYCFLIVPTLLCQFTTASWMCFTWSTYLEQYLLFNSHSY